MSTHNFIPTGDASTGTSAELGGMRRHVWMDNLRTAVIVLVVNMHSSVTYSHVGDWYLKDGPEYSLSDKLPYIFWIFHLQSFFMGLLFFLAGSLAHGAINRRGPASFFAERLFRLGVPALLYMAILQPLIVYGILGVKSQGADTSWTSVYAQYITTGQVLSGSGPMWFALALLFFSAALAAWRGIFGKRSLPRQSQAPQVRTLLAFAVVLVGLTAITRIVFPVGTSVFNFQLSHFPQYIVAFVVGLVAGSCGWLDALANSRRAKVAGYLALVIGPLSLGILVFLGGGPSEGPALGEHGPILYFGGWNLLALGAAFWEQLTGVGLALGMMAWFRRSFDTSSSVSRWMTDRSFAVYVFHPPILISLTLLFRALPLGPLSHILLLTITGLVLSFAVADVAKRIPWFGRLF